MQQQVSKNKSYTKVNKQCTPGIHEEFDDLESNNNFSDSIILNSIICNSSTHSQRNSCYKQHNPQTPKILITKINTNPRLSIKLSHKQDNTIIKKKKNHNVFQLINSKLIDENQSKTIELSTKKIKRKYYGSCSKKNQLLEKNSNNSYQQSKQREEFSVKSKQSKSNTNTREQMQQKMSSIQRNKQIKTGYTIKYHHINQLCRITHILLASRPKSNSKKIVANYQSKNLELKKIKQFQKRKFSDEPEKYIDLRIHKRYSDLQMHNFQLKPWEQDIQPQTYL